jgi:hypothetical protein
LQLYTLILTAPSMLNCRFALLSKGHDTLS